MMANGRDTVQIKRIRNEVLAALKVVYPAALQVGSILRGLIVVFPSLELNQLRRDLHYLSEKRYIERVIADTESDARLTPFRRRWFRLTAAGMEVVDRCILDPAMEE